MTDWLGGLEHPDRFLHSLWLSIPLCVVAAKFMFHDWDGLWYSLRLLLQPDLLSMIRGEWADDQWETIKFLLYLVLCAAILAACYHAAVSWFLDARVAP